MSDRYAALRAAARLAADRCEAFLADSNARKALGRASAGFALACVGVIIPNISCGRLVLYDSIASRIARFASENVLKHLSRANSSFSIPLTRSAAAFS